MKVLVIGQGGREHAIVQALSLSSSVTEIHALPGSDGIAKNALCHNIDWKNFEAVHQLCLNTEIDVVMIGPEDPLVAGLSDFLRERGVLTVGPSQAAANLEGSKVFAKEFMGSAKIPTAEYHKVSTVEQTLSAAKNFTPPYVLKADGLAAGKGVFICKTLAELESSAKSLFVEHSLGAAGTRALLEQFSAGWELSYLILTNGQDFQSLPISQDHKRLHENEEGPNTGGMGTIAPLKISARLKEQIDQKIVWPTLKEIQRRGFVYRGIIFFGLMITESGPSLLEYNCRFGDPETQVILPLIDEDFGQVLMELAQGRLKNLKLKNVAAACVVMAAPGYPINPEKGVFINGDLENESVSNYFLHAGTKKNSLGNWITNGGRVLNAVGLGTDFSEAIQNAYRQANKARWNGMQLRQDIGAKQKNEITSST